MRIKKSIDSIQIDKKNSVMLSHSSISTTLLMLGIGQSGNNFTFITNNTPDDVAVLAPLPYQSMDLKNVVDQIITVMETAYKQLNTKKLHIVAESQAAPAAIYFLNQFPIKARSITLIGPLGLNMSAYGNTKNERRDSLLKRTRIFWKHKNQSLSQRANRVTLWEIIKITVKNSHRLKDDLVFAANQDILLSTIKLAEKIPITVMSDTNDSLFPYEDLEKNLSCTSVKLLPTSVGSHLNRASKLGMEELRKVLIALK